MEVIRKEVSSTGSTLTNCQIQLGNGTWELQDVTVRVTPNYAVIANARIRHTVHEKNVYYRLMTGYPSRWLPLIMSYRRVVQGPCVIIAEATFSASSTITLVIAYRRVKR